jgi:hypothetical protein
VDEKRKDLLKVKRYFLDPSTPLRAYLGQENIFLNRLRTKETLVDQSLNTGLGRS